MADRTCWPWQHTIKELAERVGIEATYQGRQKDEDGWEHDAWDVTLTYQGQTYAGISYRMGTGHSKPATYADGAMGYQPVKDWKPTAPDAATVVDSLLSDVSGLDRRFEDWAADLGYDEDSRKAERIYIECLKVLPRLQALLGADYTRFEQAERL